MSRVDDRTDPELAYARALATLCATARAAGVPESEVRAFVAAWRRTRFAPRPAAAVAGA